MPSLFPIPIPMDPVPAVQYSIYIIYLTTLSVAKISPVINR